MPRKTKHQRRSHAARASAPAAAVELPEASEALSVSRSMSACLKRKALAPMSPNGGTSAPRGASQDSICHDYAANRHNLAVLAHVLLLRHNPVARYAEALLPRALALLDAHALHHHDPHQPIHAHELKRLLACVLAAVIMAIKYDSSRSSRHALCVLVREPLRTLWLPRGRLASLCAIHQLVRPADVREAEVALLEACGWRLTNITPRECLEEVCAGLGACAQRALAPSACEWMLQKLHALHFQVNPFDGRLLAECARCPIVIALACGLFYCRLHVPECDVAFTEWVARRAVALGTDVDAPQRVYLRMLEMHELECCAFARGAERRAKARRTGPSLD